MENSLRKLVRYEDRFWFIDLSTQKWIVDEVYCDGTRLPAKISWGYFMEILNSAPCISSPPSNPSEEWFKNFFEQDKV